LLLLYVYKEVEVVKSGHVEDITAMNCRKKLISGVIPRVSTVDCQHTNMYVTYVSK